MYEEISSKLIFVADNDLPSFHLITKLLSSYQVSLVHFTNGNKLMESFKKNRLPDLIILDIRLPGIDGLKLTKLVKDIDPGIPVIACTSYAMAGAREDCMQSGCDEYIPKPIDLNNFRETVKQYL